MSARRSLLVVWCTLLLGAAAPALAQDDVIKIGMTNSFSGGLAQAASPVWRGVMVWQDWVNAQGGIAVKDRGNKKLPVKVVYYDDGTATRSARSGTSTTTTRPTART